MVYCYCLLVLSISTLLVLLLTSQWLQKNMQISWWIEKFKKTNSWKELDFFWQLLRLPTVCKPMKLTNPLNLIVWLGEYHEYHEPRIATQLERSFQKDEHHRWQIVFLCKFQFEQIKNLNGKVMRSLMKFRMVRPVFAKSLCQRVSDHQRKVYIQSWWLEISLDQ